MSIWSICYRIRQQRLYKRLRTSDIQFESINVGHVGFQTPESVTCESMTSNKLSQVLARGRPQTSRQSLYGGRPWSRPRWTFSATRSNPKSRSPWNKWSVSCFEKKRSNRWLLCVDSPRTKLSRTPFSYSTKGANWCWLSSRFSRTLPKRENPLWIHRGSEMWIWYSVQIAFNYFRLIVFKIMNTMAGYMYREV